MWLISTQAGVPPPPPFILLSLDESPDGRQSACMPTTGGLEEIKGRQVEDLCPSDCCREACRSANGSHCSR